MNAKQLEALKKVQDFVEARNKEAKSNPQNSVSDDECLHLEYSDWADAQPITMGDLRVISDIAPPVAAEVPRLKHELVAHYRYKALPPTSTPGGNIMRTVTEVFESDADNTRIIIETSNGGASLRAEAIRLLVAAGSVDLHKLVIEAQERAEKAEAELAAMKELLRRFWKVRYFEGVSHSEAREINQALK